MDWRRSTRSKSASSQPRRPTRRASAPWNASGKTSRICAGSRSRSSKSWPAEASWGDWLQRLEAFAPRVLRRAELVLRVLADLRPMAVVGPVTLTEVRDVLADRLATLEIDPPAQRYGRVFVCSPDQLRGRAFRVV